MANQQINPNVRTPASEPSLQKAPGEGVSFEQMEAMMDQGERSPQVERQSTNEQKDVSKQSEGVHDGAGSDEDSGAKEAGATEPKEAVEAQAEVKEESPETSKEDVKVEGEEKPAKIYKVKNGESELELKSDTELEVTVKGESEKVTLQDMMNNYSGKVSWDRKFSELDKDVKAYESNRNLLNETVNNMYSQLVEKKDWKSTFITIAEAFNANPFEIITMVEDQVLNSVEGEGFELSAEDRQLKRRADEADYWKERLERENTRRSSLEERQRTQASLDKVSEQHGMKDTDLVESFDALAEIMPNKAEITADHIGAYFSRKQQIASVLKEVAPELDGEEFSGVVKLASKELMDSEITDDQVDSIIRSLYENSATKAISDKVKRSQDIKTESANKPTNPASDPLFFDEI